MNKFLCWVKKDLKNDIGDSIVKTVFFIFVCVNVLVVVFWFFGLLMYGIGGINLVIGAYLVFFSLHILKEWLQ